MQLSLPYRPGLRPSCTGLSCFLCLTGLGNCSRALQLSCTDPSSFRHTPPHIPPCPAALLPTHSSFLAVSAWAGGQDPYSHPVPARHVSSTCPRALLYGLLGAWSGTEKQPSCTGRPWIPCPPEHEEKIHEN
jgi:hypothetical protein